MKQKKLLNYWVKIIFKAVMKELSLQERLDMQKSDAIDRILIAESQKEILWKYHPDNPDARNLVATYNNLEQIIKDAEKELEELS